MVNEKKTTDCRDNALKSFFKLVMFLFVFLNTQSLYAAGPIVHAYLGLKWIEKYDPELSTDEKCDFILGTLFPDIRYLIDLSRKKTHFDIKTLQQVQKGRSAFEKGMRFHSYVDYKRAQYYRRHKIYAVTRKLPRRHRETFVKLVEDQIIFLKEKKEYWELIQSYLRKTATEEEDWADKTALAKWHLGLILYFNMAPSTLFNQIGIFKRDVLIFDANTISNWGNQIKSTAEDPIYQAYVQGLIDSFDL